jgi:hypothetical protein
VFTINGPWPEAESIISQSAEHSYEYATDILKGRFLKGEKAIINSKFLENYKDYLRNSEKYFIQDNNL